MVVLLQFRKKGCFIDVICCCLVIFVLSTLCNFCIGRDISLLFTFHTGTSFPLTLSLASLLVLLFISFLLSK